MKKTLEIIGMHCNACVDKIRKVLSAVPAIEECEVTLQPPRTVITLNGPVVVNELNQLIRQAGNYSLKEEMVSADVNPSVTEKEQSKGKTYFPLILIFLYLTGVVIMKAFVTENWSPASMMTDFMGGFFLVFSFFKLLDIKGFARSYTSYDLIAGKWPAYGFVYPFIELLLGAAYLLHIDPITTNITTLIVMLIGSAGVIKSLLNKSEIQCACLGTVFNLPMSYVTLIEDLLMAIMAGLMLLSYGI